MMALAWGTGAHAASFDCSKAVTRVEKTVCAEKALSDLDEQLMQTYRYALASASDKHLLKSEQKAWLTQVRNQCRDSACLKHVYLERITALAKSAGAQPKLSGVRSQDSIIRYQSLPVRNTPILFPKLTHFTDKAIMREVNRQIDEITQDFGCDDEQKEWLKSQKLSAHFKVASEVTYAKQDVFSIYASAEYYCGGPYPTNDSNLSATFDLRTGKKVEFKDLFTNYAADAGEILKILFAEQMAMAERHAAAGSADDSSCASDSSLYSLENLQVSDFAFNFTNAGLSVQPIWPHVVEACAQLITVPYHQLIKYGPPDGLLARVGQ
jgi:uncharacterized protein YecT (DUF1311 family)